MKKDTSQMHKETSGRVAGPPDLRFGKGFFASNGASRPSDQTIFLIAV